MRPIDYEVSANVYTSEGEELSLFDLVEGDETCDPLNMLLAAENAGEYQFNSTERKYK